MSFKFILIKVVHVIRTMLAMGGILLDKNTSNRLLLIISISLLFLVNRFLMEYADITIAAVYFFIYFVIRYLFLFLSFIPEGISDRLKKKNGEEKGFEIYRFITALMFFQGAASFSLLVEKSMGTVFLTVSGYQNIFIAAGVLLLSTGFIINLWSTLLVGIDVYYYKDLFMGRAVCTFEKSGPYLYLSNPMYGLGQANGYGTALIYASVLGIGGIFLNQLFMYIFYYTIERPHIKKIFSIRTAEAEPR